MFGMPLTPVAMTTCRGCKVRVLPSPRRSRTVQRPERSSYEPPSNSVAVQ